MPFQFPLETILRFCQSVEHQEELRLRAANQQVSLARQAIEEIDGLRSEGRRHQAHELGTGTTSAEVRFALVREDALRRRRGELERHLKQAEGLRDRQQKIFADARRKRETYQILREGQLAEYSRATARREQRLLDDQHLMRRTRTRHG